MRVVVDTNILILGLLWYGAPYRLLNQARLGQIELWASPATLHEFDRVSNYARLQPRMRLFDLTRDSLQAMARLLLNVVSTPSVETVVAADPQDDVFLACALAAGTPYLVSGDRHLLAVGKWRTIESVTVNEFLAQHFPQDT